MKKLPILFTLALASVTVSGCDIFGIHIDINGKDTPTDVDPEDQGEDIPPTPTPGPTPTTSYTVTFDANGGEGEMASAKTNGSKYIVPDCGFTKDGFFFTKWAYKKVSGTQYGAGETISNIIHDFTLFALWSDGSHPQNIEDDYGDYYDTIGDGLEGTQLRDALNALNTLKKVKSFSYGDLRYNIYDHTEIDWTDKDNQAGKMFSFYTNDYISTTWDGGTTWNREHVWPNSLGGGKVDGDIFMTRPTSTRINSERGNKFYGTDSSTYDPGKYEVNYRGVAARIIFYCAIADTSLSLVDATSGGNNQMGKLSDLLRWNLEYLPDTSWDAPLTLRIEQNRNKMVYSDPNSQGNRNPFVDHPSYACKIWGKTNSETRRICGM